MAAFDQSRNVADQEIIVLGVFWEVKQECGPR